MACIMSRRGECGPRVGRVAFVSAPEVEGDARRLATSALTGLWHSRSVCHRGADFSESNPLVGQYFD
jgi:hypothetical protein